MFSRKETEIPGMKSEESTISIKAAPAAPATPVKSTGRITPSIFSSDVRVVGTLHSDGDIQFDGQIEGNIESQSLTVGEKAVITGEIRADNVTVKGRVLGSVRGHHVKLSSSCHVEGDIMHQNLTVESGAFFDGNCRHAEDPMVGDTTRNPAPVAKAQNSEKKPAAKPAGRAPSSEPLPSALRA